MLKFFPIIFRGLGRKEIFFGLRSCCGQKKGDICTPNRRERRRGQVERAEVGEYRSRLSFGYSGEKEKNQKIIFTLLLERKKLHLPLQPCSKGTEENEKRIKRKTGQRCRFLPSLPNEAGEVL
ncbi:hypothetical protein B0E43_01970 [Algoriphagus sp. A40]|nr:hypothetical protein B0E43_01970 [Algoriphagus sp. A40]